MNFLQNKINFMIVNASVPFFALLLILLIHRCSRSWHPLATEMAAKSHAHSLPALFIELHGLTPHSSKQKLIGSSHSLSHNRQPLSMCWLPEPLHSYSLCKWHSGNSCPTQRRRLQRSVRSLSPFLCSGGRVGICQGLRGSPLFMLPPLFLSIPLRSLQQWH